MILTPGITSVIKHVFLQDSTVTTGAGKTALAFGDITAYYVRAGGALTALTTETIATLGTWASTGDDYLGFKLLHDTNAPGVYELNLPNNILAAGANQVTIQLRATGMAPCNIEIQLKDLAIVGSVMGKSPATLAAGDVTGNLPALVKAQDNIDFGALQKTSLNAATPASVQNIPATGSGLTALGDTRIANLDAAVSTRAPEAAGNLAAVKADVEHATYGLNALLTAIGTRMATFTYTAPDSATTIAAAVWASVTRSLTDKAGFLISGTKTTLDALNDITAASVWAVGTRTLTSFGSLVADVATAVWGAVTRTLTAGAGITAQQIWEYATRALTDKAGFSISGTKQTLDILHDLATSDIDARLEAYDPPTRTEATADKTEVMASLEDISVGAVTVNPVQILEGLAVTMSANLLAVNIDGVATNLTLKQGEAKTLLITVLDADGVAVNLSAATLTMGFKVTKADVAYVIEKDDADFDKTLAASGIVSVDFTETDTDQAVATYIGELKASWTGGAVINKSADIKLKIKEAVIPAA